MGSHVVHNSWYIKIVCKLIMKWRKIKINVIVIDFNFSPFQYQLTYNFNIPTTVNNTGSQECIPSVYLDFVLFWPDDGCLQPKHVAKNVI